MKVLDLIREKKISYAEVAKICDKNQSSIRNFRESVALVVTLQTVQVTATVHDECTAKTEMVLSVYSFERHTHTISLKSPNYYVQGPPVCC